MNTDPITVERLDELTQEDGYDDGSACGKCPLCEVIYSGNGGYLGPVWDLNGEKYETFYDTEPGDGPFVCEKCIPRCRKAIATAENKTITDYL